MHGLENRRVLAGRIDVARRRDADRAGGGGAEIGKDVAEGIGGDDHVEAIGIEHRLDRKAVDVILIGANVGEPPLHLLEPPAGSAAVTAALRR
jgi:hypothetical protein